MPSTAKIVLSIIAFYVVTGIYNFSGSGTFITPFFLNYLVLVGVGSYTYLINTKQKYSYLLGIYLVGLIALASAHSLTLSLLNRWLGLSEHASISANDLHKLASIIIFYGSLLFVHSKAVKHHQTAKWFWLPALFLIGSLLAVLLNSDFWQAILLSTYLLCFMIFSNRLNTKNYETYSALVFQYGLFLVIENIRYFTSG